ncbi:helicase-exonuclease AddAB subunit AddA [Streptococcus sp. zg-JUN1979]|uniref:helicase-exonuclease AddAB subunit AddA n=1 Tax=Streptococcus sp. zg-JUN1979 TaxID=3391450 RepID=UPI0039A4C6B1
MRFEPFLSPETIVQLQEREAKSDKEQKRTPEQIEAIYTNGNNVLVSASAGSGKTFVMVERIMDQLTRGVGIDELFISTFTVKAASELKERLETKLREKINTETNTELKAFLTQQLANVQLADIGTMDAFTQKLLSQYGYTLGISPQFRILQDDNEQLLIKNDVFADLFADYMQGKDADLFMRLVKNVSGNAKSSQVFRQEVYKIYTFSQATDNPQYWLDEIFLKGAKTYTDLASLGHQVVDEIIKEMQDTADKLEDITNLEGYRQQTAKGKISATYQKHLNIIASLREWALHFDSLYGLSGLGRLAKDSLALLPKSLSVAGKKYDIFTPLRQLMSQYVHIDIIIASQQEALPMLELLQAFVRDFSEQYLQAKMQESAFEFSDISHLAIRILEENEAIRKHYQERYHEVMVDEYQDNNHTQERLLELLSNGHNRFMVGDIKQSIYRFRQADPQIFNHKFKDFQKHPEHGSLIILKENFRSQSEVVDSTNDVFKHLMDEEVGEILYDDSHALKVGSEGQAIAKPHNQTQILLFDEESIEEDFDFADIRLVAKEIIRLHQKEQVAFEDMALLVSTRTHNNAIIKTLESYGIPVLSDSGEKHYLESLEVMVMLDTLRAIQNPLNDYALVALLRSPMFAFNEDDLTRLSLQSPAHFKKQFFEKIQLAHSAQGDKQELITDALAQKVALFLEIFTAWRTFSKTHLLYDLIWKIYQDRFYYDYVGNLPNSQQRQANLYALALRANQYERSGFKGLSRFITMIDKVISNDKDLMEVEMNVSKDAVNLMTIHNSKGLEFKYVFILSIHKEFNTDDVKSPMLLSRDLGIGIKYLVDLKEEVGDPFLPKVMASVETFAYQMIEKEIRLALLSERMRLLYVAMTRAKERLYLVGQANSRTWSDKYSGVSEANHLPVSDRKRYRRIQDWLLAIYTTYQKSNLAFSLDFVSERDLTDECIGSITQELPFDVDDQAENRQTDEIRQAIASLEAVETLNQSYQAAIDLPSVRTPSQVKKLYEPISDIEGVDILEKRESLASFDFKALDQQKKVDAALVGSTVHQLMQALDMTRPLTQSTLRLTLNQLDIDDKLKKQIHLDKIEAFFKDTALGQLIQTEHKHLYREAPFAMLKKDKNSGESFVVRGIVDGYLLFDDRIVLFDYKTDKFTDAGKIKERYASQMQLYAEALSQSYGISHVEKYLVLLGGQELHVVTLD